MNEVMPLPPFSGDDVACPKCGNKGASTAWWSYGRIDVERVSLGNPDLWPERLHRECRRCSYSWDEAVVSDSPQTPERLFCGAIEDLDALEAVRGTMTATVTWAPPALGSHVRPEVVIHPIEGVAEMACVSLPDGGLKLTITRTDGVSYTERWVLARELGEVAVPEADAGVEPSTVGETPTVDVYGEDKSWMVPLIVQYMNAEEVVLPPRATSFRAGVADERPTRFWAVVMRDDGSEVEYSWRVDFS